MSQNIPNNKNKQRMNLREPKTYENNNKTTHIKMKQNKKTRPDGKKRRPRPLPRRPAKS